MEDPIRNQKLNYLNQASTSEVLGGMRFLTREQQNELQWQYLGRFYRFALPTDSDDRKYTSRIRNEILVLAMSVLPFRYIEQAIRTRTNNFRTLTPTLQTVCRVATMHRGVLIYFGLTCLVAQDIVRLSYRIAYKHYILDQYDRNNI